MAARKSKAKKYGQKAKNKISRVMDEFSKGILKSGHRKSPVRSRKQAIAIGMSEARRAGGKVPPKRRSRRS